MSDKRLRLESDGNGGFIGWIEKMISDGEVIAICIAIVALLIAGPIYLVYWILWKNKIGRICLGIILTISVLCAIIRPIVDPFYLNPLEYSLSDNGEYYSVSGVLDSKASNIEIPATIDGKPVKYISDAAFKDCESITSVTIPNGILSIGASAFEGCKSLTSVVIPNSVTSIGDSAFDACTSLTNIVIPDSVTNIGNAVFQWCSSLTNVILPNNMDNIPQHMFYCCDSLKSIDIPNGVTRIERCAFASCDSLASVNIPKSVNYIGELAFARINSTLIFNYLGTKSQWEVIEKVNTWSSIDGILNWDYGTDNYTVSCTNGTFSK